MSNALVTYADLANADPLRSPSWRYERAVQIFEKNAQRFSSTRDDALTREMVRFLSCRRHVHTLSTHARQRDLQLFSKFRHLWSAYKIFDQPEQDSLRSVIEARLVSGQAYLEIAQAMSLEVEAVQMYHDLFFNVRDRLGSIDYIARFVIGPVFRSGIEEFNPDLMLKYFGYFGGPRLVQAILYGFQSPLHPATDADLMGWLDGKVSDNLRIQTLVTTTVLRPTKFDVRTLIEGYTSLLALDQKMHGIDEQTDWIMQLIRELNKNLPAVRGKDALEFVENRKLSYSVGEVELRAHEQLAVARGEQLPHMEQLATFHRPDPESPVGVTKST